MPVDHHTKAYCIARAAPSYRPFHTLFDIFFAESSFGYRTGHPGWLDRGEKGTGSS